MSVICRWIAAIVLVLVSGASWADETKHVIVTSDLLRITSAAARDEGYRPGVQGTFLQESRTADGREPLPGYESIGLYQSGHLARSYAVRIATGDIVDPMQCQILRYPDLIKFKELTSKTFGSKEASVEEIETEVGCDELKTIP